jgi:hypothetical protein
MGYFLFIDKNRGDAPPPRVSAFEHFGNRICMLKIVSGDGPKGVLRLLVLRKLSLHLSFYLH